MKLDFILVSQSPRRRELLKNAGYLFEAVQVDTEETLYSDLSPQENAQIIAKYKVLAYLNKNPNINIPLVGADTIVLTQNNEILGKPKNRTEALSFLQKLQGNIHTVITGVIIKTIQKEIMFYAETKVHIRELSNQELEYYIDTFQPYDKAGAYGVQDWFGLRYIYKIEGCYYNVVGFPVSMFDEAMKNIIAQK